ncbi:MAG TPA: DNA translocase FtsK, partial [Pirellulales bacterium]
DEAAAALSQSGGGVQVAEPKSSSALRVRPPKKRDERQEVMNKLDAASRTEETPDYQLPPIDLLMESEPFAFEEQEKEVRRKAKLLEQAFTSFGLNVRVVEIETGPVIAQFEVELEAGLRLSKITALADDLAIALRVPSVRIVAPIPGKNTVGVEVPNAERQLVRLREVIEESQAKAGKMRIPIFLGKDVAGNPMVADLTSLPHLLIAGRTGTGKSVCLNTMIVSMLMARRPDEVRMLLIDPKMVELSPYKTLPHLMHPVVTDMRKAEAILAWAVEKMEERYALLARAGVRHIAGYNQLGEEELFERLRPESDEERENIPTHLPYIVIVADEMADLMMTAAKEVETHIIRLAQKSRAVGIHLVLATQKPTVDVITGLIKSNLPARIAFQVASRTDSRVVLDEMGADKLLGNGDMLFLWPGTSTLLRGQGTYVSDEEINKVVDFVSTTEQDFVKELVQLKANGPEEGDVNRFKNRDDLYEAAIEVVIREGRGSVSLLQRSLGIGYGRGARLIDFMAEDGIVGAYNGSQAREVLITLEQWQAMSGQNVEAGKPTRTNRVTPARDEQAERPSLDAGEDEVEDAVEGYEDSDDVIDVESEESDRGADAEAEQFVEDV